MSKLAKSKGSISSQPPQTRVKVEAQLSPGTRDHGQFGDIAFLALSPFATLETLVTSWTQCDICLLVVSWRGKESWLP